MYRVRTAAPSGRERSSEPLWLEEFKSLDRSGMWIKVYDLANLRSCGTADRTSLLGRDLLIAWLTSWISAESDLHPNASSKPFMRFCSALCASASRSMAAMSTCF
jgi:hypothetical protein